MTTRTSTEVAKRKAKKVPTGSFAEDLLRELNALLERASFHPFPNPAYQKDPVGFFRRVLGIEPWDRQIEVIEAVRDHDRVAVCSGHKIGKSNLIAGLALWFYCSFSDARAIMSSTTSRQVDQILWRELRMLRARGGRCVDCKAQDPSGILIPRPCPHSALILEEPGELARTGIKSEDFREVVGFTAREAEAVAGVSGRNLLYLLDEASGIPDVIFEAIEGNRAGGAKIILAGNGTRNEGEFFEAFTSKAHLYKTIRVSSETTPNVVQGRVVIPGLATREWVEEKRLEWGEESALYKVRVKGEHAIAEEGKIFSLHMIGEAERRWHETIEAGRLFVGVDPAGSTGRGDETMLCARRGMKQLGFRGFTGLDPLAHVNAVTQYLRELRLPKETPVIVVDREGPIGTRVSEALLRYAEHHPGVYDLVSVRASDGAQRDAKNYDRQRDVLAANLLEWMRNGGAIVEDTKLESELHALEWRVLVNGKQKVTPKEDIRKALGRSPDRYDALALAVWESSSVLDQPAQSPGMTPAEQVSAFDAPINDPFAGAAIWQR